MIHSINFCALTLLPGVLPSMWPEELPLTFRADGRTSVNFHLLPMQPGDFPSTYVNFPCGWETFCQPPSTLCAAEYLLVTFRATGRPSINFRQLSVQKVDLPSSSVNSLFSLENFRQIPSTLCAAERTSLNLCLHSVRSGDLPSTSVNFPCRRETSH